MMWIWAKDIENLSFSGHGTIHGNGIQFMGAELFDSYELKPVTTFDPRPHVLTLIGVKNLSIRDITICEGAYWTVHLIGCDGALIDGINLLNNLKYAMVMVLILIIARMYVLPTVILRVVMMPFV